MIARIMAASLVAQVGVTHRKRWFSDR